MRTTRWATAAVALALGCSTGDSVVGGDASTDIPVDTGPADTGPVDTGPRDSGPADTGPADTGPTDTGPADVPVDAPDDVTDASDDVPADAPDVVDVPVDTGPMCTGGTTLCGGACVDTQSSTAHCGACDNACPAGQMCASGTCALSCTAPLAVCGTGAAMTCVDTTTSAANCGSCGNACPSRANSAPACTASACGLTCNTGFGDCNAVSADGCEVDTRADVAHCGACNNACASPPGASATCTASACGFTCNTGRADCNSTASDGCEVDTTNSAANCGMCGNACPSATRATGVCAASACGLACDAGYGDCDGNAANGCEVDTRNTNSHCGRCGSVCASGQTCIAGRCEATACPPPAVSCPGGVCPTCTRVLFREDWESGIGAWNLPRGGTTPITTITDSSDCRGSFLRETERFSAGRVFTRAPIPVTAGATYCVSAWIRGSAGTWPFIGMRASNTAASIGAEHWLIGQPCFGTGLSGTPVSPVTSDGNWRFYSRQITMPAYTHILLEIEIWDGGAAGTADFDQVQLIEGPCPATPPVVVCTAATCP